MSNLTGARAADHALIRRLALQTLFVTALLAAAAAPYLSISSTPDRESVRTFPGWLTAYDGHPLTPLPLSRREERFAAGFPGRIGRFSDGQREVILRWIETPTRLLHPASDCFRGLGYTLSPAPMRKDTDGRPMACFIAQKASERYSICELIVSTEGESWPDVSAWYWTAILKGGEGPWWSIVTATHLPGYHGPATTN